MIILLTAGLILIYSISAYGWGGLAVVYLYKNTTRSVAFVISLGLAIWVFLGGLLNAFGQANALAVDIIFVLGILFFALFVYGRLQNNKTTFIQSFRKKFRYFQDKTETRNFLQESIPILLTITAASLFIFTLLPSNAFNHHDDFYTYFPRLFRMLQTGRLGDLLSFDFVGFDSLGAHQFLQSFLLSHFPINYINGFDTVFCFLLGAFLLNDIGNWFKGHWLFRTLAIVIYSIINPQYVNISSLYSGSLMIFALIYSCLLLLKDLENPETKDIFGAAIIFAFFSATLMALKYTFIPFAVSFISLFFLLLLLFSKKRKKIASIATISASMTGIIIAPWLWSVYDKIIYFFTINLHKLDAILMRTRPEIISPEKTYPGTSVLPGSPSVSPESPSVLSDLFSTKELFYGGNASDYSFIVLCTLGAALWASSFLITKRDNIKIGNLIIVTSLGISVPFAYLVSGFFADDFGVGIRYSCPVIIAAFPALVLLFSGNSGSIQNPSSSHEFKIRQGAVVIVTGICIVLFLPGWNARFNQLYTFRTMLAYPGGKDNSYLAYQRKILSETEQESVLSMQDTTEKKSAVFAWFESAFYLNFERNTVFVISAPDFLRRASKLTYSDFADGEKLGNYLRSVGIRYVIWGYRDHAPKQNNTGSPELAEGIFALTKKSQVIYNDGRRVVLDINVY